MQKVIKEAITIILVGGIMAFIANAFSPHGIPLFGQWDETQGVVKANPGNEKVAQKIEIDDVSVAKQYYDKGQTLFVDARSELDYNQGHIKGAISLPVGEFDHQIDSFLDQYPPEQLMIAYCWGRTCEDSHFVAQMLMDFGYENVSVMIDGFPAWKKKGYPIE